MLLTTRYLDDADQLADAIVVIDHGRVIATGTPADLKAKVGGHVLEVAPADRSRLADVAALLAAWTGAEPVSEVLPTGAAPKEITLTEATVPQLVEQAYAVARQRGFPLNRDEAAAGGPSACLHGVGRFLAMLAAGCNGGVIGELGTGAGIGAAWIASAMPVDCRLVTAELDSALATAASQLLADDARVSVLSGDASTVLAPHAPFDLIFADCGVRDTAAFRALCELLRPGGRIVMYDLTPVRARSADLSLRAPDIKRELFAGQDSLTWTEVVLPDLTNSLLVGTRR